MYCVPQAGVTPGTYKWKGRQEQSVGLNPEVLYAHLPLYMYSRLVFSN